MFYRDNVGDIIADIFGEDEEDEEFKGFKEDKGSSDESVHDQPTRIPKLSVKFAEHHDDSSRDSAEPGPSSYGLGLGEVSDFDIIMNKRKEAMRRRRKRAGGMRSGVRLGNMDNEEREAMDAGVDELIHDADDVAMALVQKMSKASDEDRQLVENGKLACKKLTLLPEAIALISK